MLEGDTVHHRIAKLSKTTNGNKRVKATVMRSSCCRTAIQTFFTLHTVQLSTVSLESSQIYILEYQCHHSGKGDDGKKDFIWGPSSQTCRLDPKTLSDDGRHHFQKDGKQHAIGRSIKNG